MVVLPEPMRPTMPTRSPGWMRNETPSSAGVCAFGYLNDDVAELDGAFDPRTTQEHLAVRPLDRQLHHAIEALAARSRTGGSAR